MRHAMPVCWVRTLTGSGEQQDEDMGIRDLCNDRSHMLNEEDADMETDTHQFPWISPTALF